ncbi:hypothetical protein C943_00562 [Mariniradius saccharolyticus AK6]|uniref:Uncharacterized protein n=1 Tax=Mariniradius saccharolyticus AK6 TaxID=1239962 RepID=M7XEH1_9BACT|nr:hypothetical protein C943_00562 [Mariniradius saccharolyticus AK6]
MQGSQVYDRQHDLLSRFEKRSFQFLGKRQKTEVVPTSRKEIRMISFLVDVDRNNQFQTGRI